MIRLKNVKFQGARKDITLASSKEEEIDASHLTALKALVDPHVHFRVPGGEHKEDWKSGAVAALHSGVTCVLDMPNNVPSVCTVERLQAKKKQIDSELKAVGIELSYGLYLGADRLHLNEISKAKGLACGVKVFMGCSTGDLLIDTQEDLEEVFRLAAENGLIVAVHAEDEAILHAQKKRLGPQTDPRMHSVLRSKEAALVAVKKAIDAASKYNTTLYLLHLSTKEEMDLVREAKKAGVNVFAETTPHHLFLNEDDYATWGTLVQMNPPLRTKEDSAALWKALEDGTLDTIGTDHAPHTLEEKKQPFGKAPSGIPAVDTYLALLLNAVNEGKLTLQKLQEVTRDNAMKLFGLPQNDDLVLVDMNLTKKLEGRDVKTKCGWSPYMGRELKGWPIYTIIKGRLFKLRNFEETQ